MLEAENYAEMWRDLSEEKWGIARGRYSKHDSKSASRILLESTQLCRPARTLHQSLNVL